MVTPEFIPQISTIAAGSRHYPRHRSVFPSATRVNSASIATGCYPMNHGLAGNALALDEGHGLQPVSVGTPEFRERWRAATGKTLHRPTLTERLRSYGGVKIYSNSSAGAAHMQDPDGHGWLFHRTGSHSPDFGSVAPDETLNVGYDANGDRVTTARFCDALLTDRETPCFVLWICEPDHSQHELELGSHRHRTVLSGADECVGNVWEALHKRRAMGDEVLFVLCSDHGHETVSKIVPLVDELVAAGLKANTHSSDVVLASSGMGGHLYFSEENADRVNGVAAWLQNHDAVDRVFIGDELKEVGQSSHNGRVIAFSMAKQDRVNRFGISGHGHVMKDIFTTTDSSGFGQHGGLGRYETNPMLVVNGGEFETGVSLAQTSAVDLAPTILCHLGISGYEMDGKPLQHLKER